jgi:hypothetical protein
VRLWNVQQGAWSPGYVHCCSASEDHSREREGSWSRSSAWDPAHDDTAFPSVQVRDAGGRPMLWDDRCTDALPAENCHDAYGRQESISENSQRPCIFVLTQSTSSIITTGAFAGEKSRLSGAAKAAAQGQECSTKGS